MIKEIVFQNKKYKMEYITSPEKKISTEVLFRTYYHSATDNSQSNQHHI
jgi:hypothetical protein